MITSLKYLKSLKGATERCALINVKNQVVNFKEKHLIPIISKFNINITII